ncbi:MAG: hypothetical protein WC810_10645 [Janthinobacterium sp.]|jgi:hypothetical protein
MLQRNSMAPIPSLPQRLPSAAAQRCLFFKQGPSALAKSLFFLLAQQYYQIRMPARLPEKYFI